MMSITNDELYRAYSRGDITLQEYKVFTGCLQKDPQGVRKGFDKLLRKRRKADKNGN